MSLLTRKRPGRPSLSNEALLDCALDLFLANGFERTSIDAICAAAGMAKRTVYARYGDKQSLFKAALTRAIEEWIVPIERLRAAECDDLDACLLAIGQILVGNIMRPAGLRLMRLTNAVSGRMPEIGAFNVQFGTQPTIDYLADLFRRRIGSEGQLPYAQEAAASFLNLVTGPALPAAWGIPADPAAIDRNTRFVVQLFLNGLLANNRADNGLISENRRLRKLLSETATTLNSASARLLVLGDRS